MFFGPLTKLEGMIAHLEFLFVSDETILIVDFLRVPARFRQFGGALAQ